MSTAPARPGRRLSARIPRWLIVLGVVWPLVLVATQVTAYLVSPPDRDMGHLQKIMYVHVPAAWNSFIAFFIVAVWALKPDRLEEKDVRASRLGVFAVTTVAFFLAEMGDKTQIATAILAARYDAIVAVVAGTTLGMLIADAPVVFAGKLAAGRIPFAAVRKLAAGLFIVLGVWVLWRGI